MLTAAVSAGAQRVNDNPAGYIGCVVLVLIVGACCVYLGRS